MELLRIECTGEPLQCRTAPGSPPAEHGLAGVAMSPKAVDGAPHTVVQLLLDDDLDDFDDDLLDGPLVAELRTPAGDLVTRDLFDHDRFRRMLDDEERRGEHELRGVLVRTNGALPPHYIRLAFLRTALADTGGCQLAIVRARRDDLLAGIEVGRAQGAMSEREARALRIAVEQRHPA